MARPAPISYRFLMQTNAAFPQFNFDSRTFLDNAKMLQGCRRWRHLQLSLYPATYYYELQFRPSGPKSHYRSAGVGDEFYEHVTARGTVF
jgi:hypothetical protein